MQRFDETKGRVAHFSYDGTMHTPQGLDLKIKISSVFDMVRGVFINSVFEYVDLEMTLGLKLVEKGKAVSSVSGREVLFEADEVTPSLFDDTVGRARASRAVDGVNQKFGKNSILLANTVHAKDTAPERIAFDKTALFSEGKGDNVWVTGNEKRETGIDGK